MVTVIGEAILDVVNGVAHVGGSPLNVSIGLARLGQPTLLAARLSTDADGARMKQHVMTNGVDLSLTIDADEPSSIARVDLAPNGDAIYDFRIDGTSDWQWTDAELARVQDGGWLHTGSMASWLPPGSDAIQRRLRQARERGRTVISYDPNVRPDLMGDRAQAVRLIEDYVGLAHVVKCSAEDLAWLYPGHPIDTVLRGWVDRGPGLAVATDGPRGVVGVLASDELIALPGIEVDVVDTVGAGDAFMAGLIDALMRAFGDGPERYASIPAASARPVLSHALLVAAITCQRAGANPPTAAEVAEAEAATTRDQL